MRDLQRLAFEIFVGTIIAVVTCLPGAADPSLGFSTYLGGGGEEQGHAVAVAPNGTVYVAGTTRSDNLPVSARAHQPDRAGEEDVFVAQFAIDGTLFALTYLGGVQADHATAIAIDLMGNVHVAGWTTSFDFPTVNAAQSVHGDPPFVPDAFLTKLSADLSTIYYSTFLGGAGDDRAEAVAVASDQAAYLLITTGSSGLFTPNGVQPALAPPSVPDASDAYVARYAPSGASITHATYLGGGRHDVAQDMELAADGSVHVVGYTNSPDFPRVSPVHAYRGGFQDPTSPASRDAFVTHVAAGFASLQFSSHLGGLEEDLATGVSLGPFGAVHVAGATASEGVNPLNPSGLPLNGATAPFVILTDPGMTVPSASTLIRPLVSGPGVRTVPLDLMVDGEGAAHLAGFTTSHWLPIVEPVQGTLTGTHEDAFVAKLHPDGAALDFLTYLGGGQGVGAAGGPSVDRATALSLDHAGGVVVSGVTRCDDFPLLDAVQGSHGGPDDPTRSAEDAFVTRYRLEPARAAEPSALDRYSLAPVIIIESGNKLVLGWEETMGGVGRYGLEMGTLNGLRGGGYDHVGLPPCSYTENRAEIDMPPGNRYFLVVGQEQGRPDSSRGRDSRGLERPGPGSPCN